jgi:hypothetical protein
VAACPLNVRLALHLENVPSVHGENVVVGLLQGIIARVVMKNSWLLLCLGTPELFTNGKGDRQTRIAGLSINGYLKVKEHLFDNYNAFLFCRVLMRDCAEFFSSSFI